jgi:hypothetical protein
MQDFPTVAVTAMVGDTNASGTQVEGEMIPIAISTPVAASDVRVHVHVLHRIKRPHAHPVVDRGHIR